jgi:hypothetical protein
VAHEAAVSPQGAPVNSNEAPQTPRMPPAAA